MSSKEDPPIFMSEDGLKVEIKPKNLGLRQKYESFIREEYRRCRLV